MPCCSIVWCRGGSNYASTTTTTLLLNWFDKEEAITCCLPIINILLLHAAAEESCLLSFENCLTGGQANVHCLAAQLLHATTRAIPSLIDPTHEEEQQPEPATITTMSAPKALCKCFQRKEDVLSLLQQQQRRNDEMNENGVQQQQQQVRRVRRIRTTDDKNVETGTEAILTAESGKTVAGSRTSTFLSNEITI